MLLFTADKSYLDACGWLRETDKLSGGDGCYSAQEDEQDQGFRESSPVPPLCCLDGVC